LTFYSWVSNYKKTVERNLYSFVVIQREDIGIVLDDVGDFVEVEDTSWIARVCHIWK
jgi:hypothetical protein